MTDRERAMPEPTENTRQQARNFFACLDADTHSGRCFDRSVTAVPFCELLAERDAENFAEVRREEREAAYLRGVRAGLEVAAEKVRSICPACDNGECGTGADGGAIECQFCGGLIRGTSIRAILAIDPESVDVPE